LSFCVSHPFVVWLADSTVCSARFHCHAESAAKPNATLAPTKEIVATRRAFLERPASPKIRARSGLAAVTDRPATVNACRARAPCSPAAFM
jgi:hypothetical protein